MLTILIQNHLMTDDQFLDFLFAKLTDPKTMDVDLIDLHADDAAMADSIELEKLFEEN